MKAEDYNAVEIHRGDITPPMIVELARFWQSEHGLESDGKIGPATQRSIAAAMEPDEDEQWKSAINSWESWDGPLDEQPRSRTQVYQMFGNPGSVRVDKDWQYDNIVELHGPDRLPGVPARWYVKLHEGVEPYAREGLRRAAITSGYRIQRFGGFVFRHIRHDSSRPLSYHSFGIAFDVDAKQNYAKTFKSGNKPMPWDDEWMSLWPDGVDRAFVDALKSCGWRWGGDYKSYIDPMHFEWIGTASV